MPSIVVPGASRVAFATVVKAWSAPTTWPAAVVTTSAEVHGRAGLLAAELGGDRLRAGDCGERLDGGAAQARRRIAELERDLARRRRPCRRVARSVAPVFETPVLLGTGYETTAGRGRRERRIRRPPAEACRSRRRPPTAPAGAEPTSSALARSAAIPIVGVASLMVVVGRQSGSKNTSGIAAV